MSYFTKIMLVLLITLLVPNESNASIFNRKRHVKIFNNLGAGLDLTLHCKSKDDDLGEHVLRPQPEDSFSIDFNPNIFGETLYFCSFAWTGEFHRFDIYKGRRDFCIDCIWSVFQTGPCLAGTDFNDPACYQWDS